MRRDLRSLVVVAALGAAVWTGARAVLGSDAPGDDVVVDRLWLDHEPRNDRDTFQLFAILAEDGVGIFQATSLWKGEHELFQLARNSGDGRYLLVFPQSGEREEVTARVTTCNRGPYTYCLELRGASRGVKEYVSRKEWRVGSREELQRATAALGDGRAP